MAPNADAMCRALVRYLAAKLGTSVELVEGVRWAERERLLDAGEIDLCWICGLPYVEKVDRGADLALSVAPVMRGERYGGRPVYFSEVLVRSDSRYTSFADLEGKTVAYNEPRSHSGYNLLCYHLALERRTLDYFGRMVEAGAHQASLELILAGEVAAAAVDTTVFDAEAQRDPGLRHKVRAIATLGPSPAPPWVFSGAVPETTRAEITGCLAAMHADADGAAILASWGIAEMRPVRDADYGPIRDMARIAASARPLRAAPHAAPGIPSARRACG